MEKSRKFDSHTGTCPSHAHQVYFLDIIFLSETEPNFIVTLFPDIVFNLQTCENLICLCCLIESIVEQTLLAELK